MVRRKSKKKDREEKNAIVLHLPDPTRIAKGELSKSSKTRLRILNAAIDCLAETGYAGTTTSTVALRAGLTRTAMLYHFPSRSSLIEGTVYQIMRCRLDMYVKDVIEQKIFDPITIVDLAWKHLQTNAFAAFTELLIAAHTDDDLSSIFEPALAEYDRARRELSLISFTEEQKSAPWFNLRRDIFRFLLEGFAMQRGLSYNAQDREGELLAFLKVLVGTPEGDKVLGAAISKKDGPRRRRGR
jgi:AcrR family transcriptional regulator